LTEYSILYIFSHFGEVKFCTKQTAKYTDRLFLFIFIFHIFAKFRTPKTPEAHTEYSFIYIYISHFGEASHQTERQIYRKIIPFYFYFIIFWRKFAPKKQTPLGLGG
jgi:hypothetical protein